MSKEIKLPEVKIVPIARKASLNWQNALITFSLSVFVLIAEWNGVNASSVDVEALSDVFAKGNLWRIMLALPGLVTIALKLRGKKFDWGVFKSKNFIAQVISSAAALFLPVDVAAAFVPAAVHALNSGYHFQRDGISLESKNINKLAA